MIAFSLGLSARLVMRYGLRAPLAFGLAMASLALFWVVRSASPCSRALQHPTRSTWALRPELVLESV
jgi:hypothetical protein